MPQGLKKYMEIELFLWIQLKVGHGISLSTAHCWMHKEGFQYISHKKGLYFDGHDRPDVAYCQEVFLPTMKNYEYQFVKYNVGDVDKESTIPPQNYVEHRLVLCLQDEMTAQANDSHEKSWVLGEEHHLRKKGPGCGLHKSDTICSTTGWLKNGSQTLEYGKNYDGYWTGELFVKQVCATNQNSKQNSVLIFILQLNERIIPAFEEAHGAGYQALFLIDNSQGHSTYSPDALLVSRMNVGPAKKQAIIWDGWFTHSDGHKVTQPMVFPANHPEYVNKPKGIKVVLTKCSLYQRDLQGKCKSKCDAQKDDCCNKKILEQQPDFLEQKSLVQETIKAAGHLCLFFPKFHCELNFIEYFWAQVKKYL